MKKIKPVLVSVVITIKNGAVIIRKGIDLLTDNKR